MPVMANLSDADILQIYRERLGDVQSATSQREEDPSTIAATHTLMAIGFEVLVVEDFDTYTQPRIRAFDALVPDQAMTPDDVVAWNSGAGDVVSMFILRASADLAKASSFDASREYPPGYPASRILAKAFSKVSAEGMAMIVESFRESHTKIERMAVGQLFERTRDSISLFSEAAVTHLDTSEERQAYLVRVLDAGPGSPAEEVFLHNFTQQYKDSLRELRHLRRREEEATLRATGIEPTPDEESNAPGRKHR